MIIGFAGIYLWSYLLGFMSQRVFKRISLVLIEVIGVMTLVKVVYEGMG